MKTLDLKFKVMNRYRLTLIDSRTNTVKQDISFHNTVTDYWKNNIMTDMNTRSVNLYLGLGDGDGKHVASDDALFHPVWNANIGWRSFKLDHEANASYFSAHYSRTLLETEANFQLSELSLSESWSSNNARYPYCLANFQDSEGHSIKINKTHTDILVLDIELQFTLDTSSLPSNVHINLGTRMLGGIPSSPCGRVQRDPTLIGEFKDMLITTDENGYGTIVSWMTWAKSSYSLASCISLNPNKGFSFCPCFHTKYYGSGDTKEKVTIDSRVYNRMTINNVALSSDGNLLDSKAPYQIMSLGFNYGNCSLGIDLPDHDIFPPTELEFQIVGDGSTTDFNLPVPILMSHSVEHPVVISHDNVEISASEYDWYGVNYQTIQPWIVCDWNNVYGWSEYQSTSWGQSACVPTSPYNSAAWWGFGNSGIWYDFLGDITIDCIGRLSTSRLYGAGAFIEYSDDKENWVRLKTFDNSEFGLTQIDPVTARYWHINPNSVGQGAADSNQTVCMPVIGQWDIVTKPTVHFHTAPGVDEVITIKAWTEYPLKSEDWIYKTVSVDICKGVN